MEERELIKKIYGLYIKYGVNIELLDSLDDERKIKGMKGVLAELDLNKKQEYDQMDLQFIQKLYSRYC